MCYYSFYVVHLSIAGTVNDYLINFNVTFPSARHPAPVNSAAAPYYVIQLLS